MNAEDQSHKVVENPVFVVTVEGHVDHAHNAAIQVKLGGLNLKIDHFDLKIDDILFIQVRKLISNDGSQKSFDSS